MLYRAGLLVALSVVSVVGCSRLSIDNRSLQYKQARVLAPLQLPAATATRPMNAIYPPPLIAEAALRAAPDFSNAKGNRYELPAPQNSLQADAQASMGVGAPSVPLLVTDGNGFPLLKVEGDAQRIWELLNAALRVSSIQVVNQDQAAGWISLRAGGAPAAGELVFLRLNRTGIMTTITLQNDKNALIDKAMALDLLTQINQNWPA